MRGVWHQTCINTYCTVLMPYDDPAVRQYTQHSVSTLHDSYW